MQYKNLFTTLLLSASVAAQEDAKAPTSRARDLMQLQMTMDAIPPATLQKLKDLPEEMMQHEAKALHFLGMQEIAAGAALMHRGMNLLGMELAMEMAHAASNGTSTHHQHEGGHPMTMPHMTETAPGQGKPVTPQAAPVMPTVVDEPGKKEQQQQQGDANPAGQKNDPTPAPERAGEAQGSTRGFETVVRSKQAQDASAADEDEEAYVP